MANNKSAQKRIEINKRNRLTNKYYKTSTRTLIKIFFQDLECYKISKKLEDKDQVQKTLNSIYSMMDKGTKKNIFHKNTAARKKAQLAAHFKSV